MKKIVLAVIIAASVMTSCKKEANKVMEGAKDAGSAVVDGAKDAGKAAVEGAKDAGTAVVDGAKKAGEAVADGAEAVADGAKGALNAVLGKVTIPTFAVAGAKESLEAYAGYAKEYIAANGNVGKISAMASKGKDLLAKAKGFASKLSGDEASKFNKILNLIMSKMAPSNH